MHLSNFAGSLAFQAMGCITAGQTYDFAIGYHTGSGDAHGSTPLDLTVEVTPVPEDPALACLLAGIGVLGATVRLRCSR